jgi:predicted transcriptional regulator
MGIEEDGNRNSYDIIADILEACRNPLRKTPLMSKASASKVTLDKILRICLMEPSLLEKKITDQGVIFYQTTAAGLEYLQKYKSLTKLAKPERIITTEAPIPLLQVQY